MKKVFHFVNTNVLSGLENMVINISNIVDGYHHFYVSPDGPINDFLKTNGIDHISVDHISALTVRRVIKQYQPDIVQGHDVTASVSLSLNFLYCARKHIAIISEIHNNDPRMKRLGTRSFLFFLSAFAYDKIIVVSSAVRDEYIFKNFIKNKIIVIPNVIDPSRIQLLKDLETSSKDWDIAFLGRFVEQKDPLKFVKIIANIKAKIPNINSIMIGDGMLKPLVQREISKLNLEKNITLVGFKSNPFPILKNIKILLITSRYEGFGLVALEAMSLGKPVVSPRVGGLISIVDENSGFFASNINDFSSYATKLIQDKKLYNEMSRSALARSIVINNIDNFKKSFKEIYK